ncbi:dirigent protein [Nocardia mexicana]|uniref:Dirigent-like protein n=1 Tax=Nocardia mexicana TaxID=279262 RepID=A0A370GIR3_9NOCA|nr:dirigent protein [Nocardia mexicana]RDI43537.1 dirigent-like protein [Nocardia mexicana]
MQHEKAIFKRISIGVAAASLLVGVTSGCSEEQTSAASEPEVHELQVTTDQYSALDLGSSGTSVGDMDVFSGSAMKDGSKVGNAGGSCQATHVDGEKVTTQCLITMELEAGALAVQALWIKGTSPLDMAITGGTGAYRNARGVVRFWDIATPNERLRTEIFY